MSGGELTRDWCVLVPRLVHPTKVAVIEAMDRIGQPLSATELELAFGGELSQSILSYHVESLAGVGALELVRKERVRGAWEHFYYFTEAVKPSRR